jgi:uncharacterized membrane protein YfcA
MLLGIVLGAFIGFYDGIFGAGSGSLLLFAFVKCFGFDFLNASASAKLINLGTFTAALLFCTVRERVVDNRRYSRYL